MAQAVSLEPEAHEEEHESRARAAHHHSRRSGFGLVDRVFEMMQDSFGTLGILSRLTFELGPARPFVHVIYERHATLADYKRAVLAHFEAQDVDFVDGIIYGPDAYVLSLGRFVDEAPYTSAYDWTKVYYSSTLKRTGDDLRTFDCFFRHGHGVDVTLDVCMETLISHNHYTREEFWSIYHKANYDAVKCRTDPDGILRDLYDTMCVAKQGR